MKKTFYQLHIGMFFSCLFCLLFIGLGIFFIVIEILNRAFILIPVGIFPIVLATGTLVGGLYYRIIFCEEKILVTGELPILGDGRTQFKDEILYSEIEQINAIYVNKDSRKRSLKATTMGALRPRLYFEFVMRNKKTKWVYVSYFSKKQREAMLKIINDKTGMNLSYDQLKIADLSLFAKRSKK